MTREYRVLLQCVPLNSRRKILGRLDDNVWTLPALVFTLMLHGHAMQRSPGADYMHVDDEVENVLGVLDACNVNVLLMKKE